MNRHADKAARLVVDARLYGDSERDLLLAEAQVHATLALVRAIAYASIVVYAGLALLAVVLS